MYSECNESLTKAAECGHLPVLKDESIKLLAVERGNRYLDCTFGGGGHTRAILDSCECEVVAIDRDIDAEKRAEVFKKKYGDRFKFYAYNFSELDKIQATNGYAGILMDLGVSSYQLDEGERGFSIRREGELDMRMDRRRGKTALELIRTSTIEELECIIREYGEERQYRKVARAIHEGRGRIATTSDLVRVIEGVIPRNFKMKIHPATLTFQGLRIAVNGELSAIEEALPKAFERLVRGGVMVVITFHSLEDRIVKRYFKKVCGRPEDRNDRSFVQDREKLAEMLTRKPIRAGDEEVSLNARSRSAKLRAIRKI